jgi:plasmid stabilization system protein ParE
MRVYLTKGATRQLRAILAYIASENPPAAQMLVLRIEEIQSLLSENPGVGYKLPRSGLRRFPVRPYPYLIYYEVAGQSVRIVRIRHSARYRPAFHDPAQFFSRKA